MHNLWIHERTPSTKHHDTLRLHYTHIPTFERRRHIHMVTRAHVIWKQREKQTQQKWRFNYMHMCHTVFGRFSHSASGVRVCAWLCIWNCTTNFMPMDKTFQVSNEGEAFRSVPRFFLFVFRFLFFDNRISLSLLSYIPFYAWFHQLHQPARYFSMGFIGKSIVVKSNKVQLNRFEVKIEFIRLIRNLLLITWKYR